MKKLIHRIAIAGFFTAASLIALAAALPADMNGLPPPNPDNISQPRIIPAPPQIDAKAYVLMDVNSGTVIAEKNMNDRLPPASLTKLMSLFLVSQALNNGSLKLNTPVLVSEEAWRTGGSRMFIKVGTEVSVNDLIQGVAVASGNDATVALAQSVGGSTGTFVDMMNQQASLLGMHNSHFTDPTGLPAEDHYTTAYDLSLLARAIWLDFPQYHGWYSQKWFYFNGIKQPNRNRLLWRYPYAVGMKTGHTDDAGYCLVGMAVNGNMTLVAVVLNAPSDEARANDTIRLLSYGFRFYTSHALYQAGATIAQPRVWFGQDKKVNAGSLRTINLTTPEGAFHQAQLVVNTDPVLKAPIKKGQQIGSVNVLLNGKVIATYPLVALTDDLTGGFFRRLIDHIAYLIHRCFGKSAAPIMISLGNNPTLGSST